MLQTGKDVFIVSDLHMGDGGPRDNFAAIYGNNVDRLKQFENFLDYVEKCDGQLVILGDMFELWQSNFGRVLIKRISLLNRLAEMKAIYVVGNHDVDFKPFIEHNLLRHPFFDQISGPFMHEIEGKSFKFMHGHEVDPFNRGENPGWGRILTIVAGVFEDKIGSPILSTGESVEKTLCTFGERMLWLWNLLVSTFTKAGRKAGSTRPCQKLTPGQKPSRLKEHIQQIQKDKQSEGYNFAIVGHTHKPGKYEDWYFNSGSWVGMEEGCTINNFLRISTDGEVNVYDWENDKEASNDTMIKVP